MGFGYGIAERVPRALTLAAAMGLAIAAASPAFAQPCEVPDNGTGTVDLPPAGCGYVSPNDLHMMIDGLPPGTTINVSAEHNDFIIRATIPGGPLGGEVEEFDSILFLDMQGTGSLAGFNRFISVPIFCRVATGPRVPGDPVQQFQTEMLRIEGEIFGDPDFDLLRITGGSEFGLPSPGQTTLTDLGNGNFNVDSFFDITYRIEFQGAPGSVLDGMSGITQEDVRMRSGETAIPGCVVPDNGDGTVDLPPANCGYLSPDDVHMIIDGLPPGTTINLGAEHRGFFNVQTQPGGSLGGEIETFDSILFINLEGTGDLAGYTRLLEVPILCETHTGPRTLGAGLQQFPTEMVALQGGLSGDPDFDFLQITGGSAFGMPSPGHTTLTRLGPPGSDFNVDSFFDIVYRIEFQGAPGGPLGGMSGVTTAELRMQAGNPGPPPSNPCEVVGNGSGTVDLPPAGCTYLSPNEVHMIIDGLPPGTEINVGLAHRGFFQVQTSPGGVLGGEIEHFQSQGVLIMQGTGQLSGFQRQLSIQLGCEVHTGPRTPGEPVQEFPNLMMALQGKIGGDPDFEFLSITGGDAFGMPSPGHTTLTQIGGGTGGRGGNWSVDSFFDITYRIDFAGAPGSILDGLGGSTTGTIRMSTGNQAVDVEPQTPVNLTRLLAPRPNPFNPTTRIPFVLERGGRVELKVYDVSGRVVRTLVNEQLSEGRHDISWNGRDDDGNLLATGTYFYELSVNGVVVDSRKATMLK